MMNVPTSRCGRRMPVAFLTHPFELALGVALALAGIRGILGDVTPSIDALPDLSYTLYVAVSTLGGAGVVVGVLLHDPPGHVGLGQSLERASLYLVAASYAVLAFLVMTNNGSKGLTTALVYVVVGAACILRTIAIRRTAKLVLLAQAHRGRPDRN